MNLEWRKYESQNQKIYFQKWKKWKKNSKIIIQWRKKWILLFRNMVEVL